MTANNMHILTAQEFIAQGTSAGAIMSIAAAQSDQYARAILDAEARILSALTPASDLASENERLRAALEEISSTEPSGHLDFAKPKHSGYSALAIAKAALERT